MEKKRRKVNAKRSEGSRIFSRKTGTFQRQVSFYCTEELFDQIQAEKVRRDATVQEMVPKALTDFFAKPVSATGDTRLTERQADDGETQRLRDLFSKYVERMPKVKLRFLEKYLILDLQHYGSSRLKMKD